MEMKTKIIRQRGENWTSEERDLLLAILRQSSDIIESKMTDTNTNNRKNNEWLKIQQKLTELSGKKRELAQIKGFWRRLRHRDKSTVYGYKNQGGCNLPESPSLQDQKIMDLCETEFTPQKNDMDSSGIFIIGEPLNEKFEDNMEVNKIIENDMDSSLDDELENITDDNEIQTERENLKRTNLNNKLFKVKSTRKSGIIDSNLNFKKRMLQLLEEEYSLKLHYQRQELSHQKMRHKLELEVLLLEKEKKALEIKLLQESVQK